MASKDIVQYNTCPHQCEYCYANASKELATENWHRHQLDPHSELIVPEVCICLYVKICEMGSVFRIFEAKTVIASYKKM